MIPTVEQVLSVANGSDDPGMVELAEFLIDADPRRAMLLAAFDAVAALLADLVLFERSEPEAPAALRAWAAERNRSVVEREIGSGLIVLSVETAGRRHIDVHLKPI